MTEVQKIFRDAVWNAQRRLIEEDGKILKMFSPNSNASVHEKVLAILMARENATLKKVLSEFDKLVTSWIEDDCFVEEAIPF